MNLPPRITDWPAWALEALEERIAIMVVDGGESEAEARKHAEQRVRKEARRR